MTSAGLSKLESTATTGRTWEPDQIVEAIIKVGADAYVPVDVNLRARIDDRMFTATCQFGTIARLEEDPDVVSVAVSRPLRVISQEGPESDLPVGSDSEEGSAEESREGERRST